MLRWGAAWQRPALLLLLLLLVLSLAWATEQVEEPNEDRAHWWLPLFNHTVPPSELPPSPCPAYFSYETDSNGGTVGLVRILAPLRYDRADIEIRLSLPSPIGSNVGDIVLLRGKGTAMEATKAMQAGRRHVLQYHVRFPPGHPVPVIQGFTVNGYELCSSGIRTTPKFTTITLRSNFKTGVTGAPYVEGHHFGPPPGNAAGVGDRNEGSRPVHHHHPHRPTTTDSGTVHEEVVFETDSNPRPRPPAKPTSSPQTDGETSHKGASSRPKPTSTDEEIEEDENEPLLDPESCGKVIQYNALVVYGTEAKKGQWPWQTAIFRTNETEGTSATLQFQCGGTLVSRKHVITAAHCVVITTERRHKQLIDTSDLFISLGKYNIRNWAEPDQQMKEVKKIIPHPDYSVELKNDLAIVELTTRVKISRFIRPVCLWDRNSELSPLVGEVGTVAGWGRDETGSLSEKLRIAGMPIVSQETCLRSDNIFYLTYTSENTFCAGFRNGTTVCNGDSGGGLHLQLENPKQSGRRTWYLRGVVSLSMPDVTRQSCDIRNFVVFTDVAKYMTWVYKTLQ